MSSPVNSGWDLFNHASKIFPVNRWSRVAYTIQVETGTAMVEGTVTEFNRADPLTGVYPTPFWGLLTDDFENDLDGITAGLYRINGYALTGIRITEDDNQDDETTTGRIMQQGESD